ncbi:MAG: single-stranded-DNA-specific exonuclease RecJ, partial [Deltaproteobacteria bacterium]|nr:single-stranded-DNA-specific exonuclease RecJ [Deltaproteobacteria bacterium]
MKEWTFKPLFPDKQKQLEQQLKLSPLMARLLVNRGYDEPDRARTFLFPSLKDIPNPCLMRDMDKAVSRLVSAIAKKEKIIIYGDYDVDGTSGTSLLILFFRALEVPVDFYVPNRLREGYSLNPEALKKLKSEGAQLIITVDNGISAVYEAEVARELGIDLIITDHHECPEVLPKASAVINPQRPDCPYPAKEICGTGVAFNLALGLRQRLRDDGYFGETRLEPNMRQFLDFVSLATVADVVPLVGINRIFVKIGLEELSRSTRPAFIALKEACGLEGALTTTDLGFRLGPRVNACGRISDASMGVRLFVSRDLSEARSLAQELNAANQQRQNVEKDILKEAVDMLEADKEASNRMGHVLYRENWHPGVIGIVASRLVEKYSRPVVILGNDGGVLKGSARSYGGLNLVEALRACSEHLIKCGGHKAAAGLTLEAQKLDAFREAFEKKVRKEIGDKDLRPRLPVDAELSLAEINLALLDELSLLEPHGQGNPAPLFCLRGVQPRFHRIVGEKHLKFTATREKRDVNAIAFGQASRLNLMNHPIDLAFACELNEFKGTSSIVLN